jgi:hypothetical protein
MVLSEALFKWLGSRKRTVHPYRMLACSSVLDAQLTVGGCKNKRVTEQGVSTARGNGKRLWAADTKPYERSRFIASGCISGNSACS